MRRAWLVWVALIVPTWIVLVLCTHWEPVLRDGWGHYNWHRLFPTTAANVWDFAKASYVHNNPRLGQVLTLLVYTPGPWHSIVTPLVELLLFWLLATLALGRRPSLDRLDDALVFATILGMVALTTPQLGPMLFYRPFTGNYLFGWVISLALLVPYRLHAETPRAWGWWWIPIQLVLGAAAGMSNEHTAPAIVAVAIVAVIAFVRRGERPAMWMIAGIVGLLIGGAALYFAPGQEVRYNGLANQAGLIERITERGVSANAKIVLSLLGYSWRLAAWVGLALAAWWFAPKGEPLPRARKISIVIGLATALAIALTLLLSPKQGPRLYFASITLACAALASAIVPLLTARWTRSLAWVIVALSVGYAGWRCVTVYHEAGPEFSARIAAIEGAVQGATVTVQPYTVPRSRWFIGDDFGVDTLRKAIAADHGLTAIDLDTTVHHPVPSVDEP